MHLIPPVIFSQDIFYFTLDLEMYLSSCGPNSIMFSLQLYYLPAFAAAACAAFFALTSSAISLYRFIQSFLLLFGMQLAILSHLSLPMEAGKVFRACSSSFCSSVVHGVTFSPWASAAVSVRIEASTSSTFSTIII